MLGWTVLIPVKPLPRAKSRLQPATADAAAHARLVQALRHDTAQAARRADGVSRVLLVDAPGLNRALRAAAADAARRFPADGVAVLVGDLPALQPEELAQALAAAAAHPRGFVADAAGTGTTLLTARPGFALEPAFGSGSAARHAATAVALPAGAGLRCDVDTATDLAAAADLGTGDATAAILQTQPHTRVVNRSC